jgi:hypothetical protein
MKTRLFPVSITTAMMLFLTFVGVPLRAQPAPADAKKDVRFRILTLEELPEGRVFYDIGKKAIPVSAPIGRKSFEYALPPGQELSLYTPVQTGETVTKRLIAKTQFPPGTHKALLVLSRAPAGSELPYTIRNLADLARTQPAGSALVFNFSTETVAVKLYKEGLMLQPGEDKGAQLVADLPYLPLQVYARTGDDQWNLVASATEQLFPKARIIVLLCPRDQAKSGPMRAVIEMELPEPVVAGAN